MAAAFPNPEAALRPGGFGRVRIRDRHRQGRPAGSAARRDRSAVAIQVIVLTPDNKAMFRPVKVGDRVGPNWIVTDGLKPGERVVVEGIQRVQMFAAAAPEMAKEGVPVVAKPYTPPPAALGGN